MSTRTCGLLWRQAEPSKKGQCQLLTIKSDGRFIWTHGYVDNSCTRVFPATNLLLILPTLRKEGSYWVGPEEMSGWNDNA